MSLDGISLSGRPGLFCLDLRAGPIRETRLSLPIDLRLSHSAIPFVRVIPPVSFDASPGSREVAKEPSLFSTCIGRGEPGNPHTVSEIFLVRFLLRPSRRAELNRLASCHRAPPAAKGSLLVPEVRPAEHRCPRAGWVPPRLPRPDDRHGGAVFELLPESKRSGQVLRELRVDATNRFDCTGD